MKMRMMSNQPDKYAEEEKSLKKQEQKIYD